MAAATSPIIPELPIIRAQGEGEQRATFFELFFDLVYVFAVTQLSHHLLVHLNWSGAAQTAFMLVAVYWAWNYTTWMTNWFDPDTAPVRLVLVFVMLASLLMSVAIPDGFGEYALLFACAYSGLQIGRNAFVVAVTPRGRFNQNFRQILAWSVLSAPLWVAGGIVDSEALRWALWLGALGLDLAAPLVTYWLPGVGATAHESVADRGRPFRRALPAVRDHRARREHRSRGRHRLGYGTEPRRSSPRCCSPSSPRRRSGGCTSARSPTGCWSGSARPASEERGQIGRDIYTYLHLPIVAGIVLVAVGDELVIAHPTDDLHEAGALVTLGGPGPLPRRADGLRRQARPRPEPAREPSWSSRCSPPCHSAPAPTVWSRRELLTALLAALVIAEQLRGAP